MSFYRLLCFGKRKWNWNSRSCLALYTNRRLLQIPFSYFLFFFPVTCFFFFFWKTICAGRVVGLRFRNRRSRPAMSAEVGCKKFLRRRNRREIAENKKRTKSARACQRGARRGATSVNVFRVFRAQDTLITRPLSRDTLAGTL